MKFLVIEDAAGLVQGWGYTTFSGAPDGCTIRAHDKPPCRLYGARDRTTELVSRWNGSGYAAEPKASHGLRHE